MTISFNTETFHDIRKELISQGDNLSKEKLDEIVSSHDVDPKEYVKEWKVYEKAKSEGFDPTEYSGVLGAPGRIVGRAVGEVGEGIIDLGAALLPEEVTGEIEEAADVVGEHIPDFIKKSFAQTFDPYHGEGIAAGVEEGIGHVGSFFIGGGPIVKALGKGMQATLGTERAASRLANAAKWGIGGAAGATLVEDPSDENFVNVLSELPKGTFGEFGESVNEMFPDLEDNFNALAVDPNDPKAKQYLNAFLNNLGLEGFFGAIGGAILRPSTEQAARAIHRAKNSRETVAQTRLDTLGTKRDRKFWPKGFSSRHGTDDTMLDMVIKRENAGKAAITRADGINQELKQSLRRAGLYDKQEYLDRIVNPALKGDETAIIQLRSDAPEAAGLVSEMRDAIDDLSMTVRDGFIKESAKDGSMYASMTANKGAYINRSYRMFDDPNYDLKDVPDDIRREAEEYLVRDLNISPDDVGTVIRNLTETRGDKKESLKILAEYGMGSSRVTKQLNDIPEVMRKLWGETHDPFTNFSKTFEKLSSLKSEMDFLNDVKQHLVANNLVAKGIKNAPKGGGKPGPEFADETIGSAAAERIARLTGSGSSQFKNPLQGLYADEAYQKFFKEGTEADGFFGDNYKDNKVLSTWLKAKSASQVSKTVLSPHTHGRNVMGNVIIMAANGMVPGGKGLSLAFKTVGNKFKNMNNRELAEEMARLQELGIVDSSVRAGIVRRVARDAFNASGKMNSFWDNIYKKTGGEAAFKLYQAEDDFFKIMHFEKTKSFLKKAYPDLDKTSLERLAAQRTRDLMPNYALVPKAIQKLRGAPVGDFMAFPAEMIRISKNLATQTMKDIGSGNPTLIKEGMKKVAGLSGVGLGADKLTNYMAEVFNITEDQQKSINELGPTWARHTPKLFLSPIKRNKNGHMTVDYVDLGPIDPFEYLKSTARLVNTSLLSGKPITGTTINKFGLELADKALGPFLGTSMITDTMLNIAKEGGSRNLEDPMEFQDFLWEAAKGTGELITPGFIDFLKKRRQFELSKGKQLGIPESKLLGMRIPGAIEHEPTGTERSKYGYHINPGSVDLGAFLGIKEQTMDISQGMRGNLLNTIRDVNTTGKEDMNNVLKDYSVSDPNEVVRAYIKGQRKKKNAYQRLRDQLHYYKHLLPDFDYDLQFGMQSGLRGRKADPKSMGTIVQATENYFKPDEISDTSSMVALEETKVPINWELLEQIYRKLDGARIE